MSDLIDRQAAIDALNGIINRFEQILRDIRESKVDDSVCGMCEYDGAFVGQSGDWCNECPGFDKDNCFKLSDRCRKRWMGDITLPSAQPVQWIPCSERLPEKRDWYLGIFEEPDTGWINPIPFICDYLLGKKTKATTKEGWILKECTDREEHIDYYFNLKCVAWMPLPEPYKGGEQDG